jgi:sporulation protein YlmC with PRC-barrel domain
MPDLNELQSWRDRDLVDRNGNEIGSIGDIHIDEQTGRPEWLAVKTGLFGARVRFVPTAEARTEGDQVRVPYEKSHVKDSPNLEADGALSQEEERRLYEHYGLAYHETAGCDVSGRETDDAMTRSEEEVHVGIERSETGRARLRKYVVTEDEHEGDVTHERR